MRAALVALVACGAQAGQPSRVAAETLCGNGDLEAICEGARVSVTAGPNPQDGPILDADGTYAVAGFAANKRSYVVFEVHISGEYALYAGGPPVSVKLIDELPTCASAARASCMRTVATYELLAGERYTIELGPIPPNQRVLLHLDAPADEVHIASVGERPPFALASALDRRGLRHGTRLGGRPLLRTVDVFDRVGARQALVRHQRVAIAEHVGTLGIATPLVLGTSARLARDVVPARALARAGEARAAHDVANDAARDR